MIRTAAATAVRSLEAADLLLALLEHHSPTGGTDAAVASLRGPLDAAGFDTSVDAAGTLIAHWGSGDRQVLLLGHIDTVPGHIPVSQHDGFVAGRGSVDAKGPLAAACAAVARLPRNRGRVTIAAVVDEEGASRGARLLALRNAPDALIVLEPSGWSSVTTGYRGCVRAEVTVSAPVGHRAGPQESAADQLLATLQRSAAAMTALGASHRVIRLHSDGDGLQERAGAAIDIRLPHGVSCDQVLTALDAAAQGAAISVESACDPVQAGRTGAVARALARSISEHGGRPRFITKTGTSDLNVVLPAWGCPAAVYGPGDAHLDHTPDERISLEELEIGADILETALRGLLQ